MANFLQTLVPLLSAMAWLLAVANSQTTSFTYDFNGSPPPTLTLQGGAHFDSGNPRLRLIETDDSGNPKNYNIGRVVHNSPVTFWAPNGEVDLQTTVRFIITAVDDNPADGLTFFIAPVDYAIPPSSTGGHFGIYDASGNSAAIFAVEFDIFSGNAWDPDYRHVGINIGSRSSSNLTRADDLVGQEVTALIRFEEARRAITVHVTVGSKSYDVSYECDLKAILPQQVQVGLSASTGGQIAHHDVIAWYFTSTFVNTGGDGIRQVV